MENVVTKAFPTMNDQIDIFSKRAIKSFGLSEQYAKQFTSVFGAMASSFKFTEQDSFKMATNLTALAGDLQSLYSDTIKTPEEAYTKLKSVFTGETESLKDIGVVMTQDALQTFADQSGIRTTIKNMSEAQKVALRYNFILDKLALAQGDFTLTSGGWANQVRVLSLQFDTLKASIGQGLITLFTPVLRVINMIISGINSIISAIRSLFGGKGGGGAVGKSKKSGVAKINDDAKALNENLGGAGGTGKKVAKELKRAFAGFDEMQTVPSAKDPSSDGGGGGGAGGGGGGLDIGEFNLDDYINFDPSEAVNKFVNIIKKGIGKLKTWLDKLGVFDFIENMKTIIQNFYDKYLSVFIADVVAGFTIIGGAFSYVWNDLIKPMFENWGGYIDELLNGSLAPFFEALMGFVGTIMVILGKLWKNVLAPIFAFIVKVIGSVIVPIVEMIGTLIIKTLGLIIDGFTGFLNFITGTIEFFCGLITGDTKMAMDGFEKATGLSIEALQKKWDGFKTKITEIVTKLLTTIGEKVIGIRDKIMIAFNFIKDGITGFVDKIVIKINTVITFFNKLKTTASSIAGKIGGFFTGMKDSIITAFESVKTNVIRAMNWMIGKLNGLSFTTPSWLPVGGGKHFGFNIPRLAEGGFVKANSPQLAMIGDNKREGEIVAPESKMREMVRQASDGGNTQTLKEILIAIKELAISVNLDGDTIVKNMVKRINDDTIANGECKLIM